MKYFILLTTLLIFSGCNRLIETEVQLSQLQSKQNINDDLYFGFGCSSHEDSKVKSNSVKEEKITISSIFKDAKYQISSKYKLL